MKNNKNSIAITAIISLTVLLIVLVFVFGFKNVEAKDSVSVQGVASIDAMPDLVSVYFNVETKADTAIQAKNNNSEIVENLLVNLVLLGFDRDEIITENFNVYPNYVWEDNQRIEEGYIARHSIKVEMPVEDSDKIGEVIDAGVDAGANINYINFELSQDLENEYKAQAIEMAAVDAKTKAEAVALGFEKRVGKLISVEVNSFDYSPWRIYGSGVDNGMGIQENAVLAKQATTSVQPGEKEIMASVSAVYKIR